MTVAEISAIPRETAAMPDEKANVIRFVTPHEPHEKRRPGEELAFERLWGADPCQKILAATIEAFRRSGYSNEGIVKTLRFAIDVLEGRER
jgi:hypothetical protein